jgi:hypothetical protein
MMMIIIIIIINDNKYSLRCYTKNRFRKNVLLYTAFDWSRLFRLGFSKLRRAFKNLFHIHFILCVRACVCAHVGMHVVKNCSRSVK